ncbi:MAG: hypothetical protein ACF8R7_12810 [Phycisphaerales bacterium JB039]
MSKGVRWLRLAIVCGAAGLLISVCAAWALSLWPMREYGYTYQLQVSDRPPEEPRSYPVYTLVNSHRFGLRYSAIWDNPGHRPINSIAAEAMRAQIAEAPDHPLDATLVKRTWPSWLPDVADDGAYSEWGARAAGWPFLCLTSRSFHRSEGNRQALWLAPIRQAPATAAPRGWAGDPDMGSVPLRPLPAGLLANATFYGAILLLLVVAPRIVRSALRRRRGACIQCGYDLRSALSTCPECGAADVRLAQNQKVT